MRRFFVSILVDGVVENPVELWQTFCEKLGDDYHGPSEERRDKVTLYRIHKLLRHRGRTLRDFGLDQFLPLEQITQMDLRPENDDCAVAEYEVVDNRVIVIILAR